MAKVLDFSFSIIPSKEIPGLISFRMDWLDLLVLTFVCLCISLSTYLAFGEKTCQLLSIQSYVSGYLGETDTMQSLLIIHTKHV